MKLVSQLYIKIVTFLSFFEVRNMKTAKIKIQGMHCKSCEYLIKEEVKELKGVQNVKVSYADSKAEITFDPNKISEKEIIKKIREHGYTCSTPGQKSSGDCYSLSKNHLYIGFGIGIILILLGAYLISGGFNLSFPTIDAKTSYALLFAAGLLTGLHCIAMCGGFVVSYTAKDASENKSKFMSHLSYGFGKTLSYMIIGGLFGLLGSFIAFTPAIRGWAAILAGLFLVIFGLKMFNIFPFLRHFSIGMPKFLRNYLNKKGMKSSPLGIGLLNGLMIACGPLQAIYIYAAGTGSAIQGALSLLAFGLGTLPVLLGFGLVASLVSNKLTHKILKLSGVIVIILGIVMLNRGLALTGSGYDFNSMITSVSAGGITGGVPAINQGYQEINMKVTRSGYVPNKFVLKKGVPVKWIIDGEEINGCNNAIQVPKLNLKFDIKPGRQIIEFTPTQSGTISWSCWMGMIPGTFIVKDDLDVNNAAAIQQELQQVQVPKGSSCGGGCDNRRDTR
jgi:sulfite exporter TauE/SafE/copper chaperone CopZ